MIAATIRRELTLLRRDFGTVASLFLLPIAFMVVVGSVFASGPVGAIAAFQTAVAGNAVLFGFFISLSTATALVAERRSGLWTRWLAAPIGRPRILVALLAPYVVIGCIQLAFLFGVGAIAFGLHVEGSLVALAAISLCVVVCGVALGLLLSTLIGDVKQLASGGAVALLTMGLVGGCMVPRLLLPASLREWSLAVPHAWALDAYHAVLSGGAGLAECAPALAMLLAFASVFGVIGLVRFRFG